MGEKPQVIPENGLLCGNLHQEVPRDSAWLPQSFLRETTGAQPDLPFAAVCPFIWKPPMRGCSAPSGFRVHSEIPVSLPQVVSAGCLSGGPSLVMLLCLLSPGIKSYPS